jgi:hypothetical protein
MDRIFSRFTPGRAGRELRQLISEAEPVALTGVVMTEIPQGLTRDVRQIEDYLSMWIFSNPRASQLTVERRLCSDKLAPRASA